MQLPPDPLDLAKILGTAIPALISAASGLVGVWVGVASTGKREQSARRYSFVTRQIEEFYSPMVGLRREIRARSELRVRVSQAANAAWQDETAGIRDPEESERVAANLSPQFRKIIDYDNQQLRSELLPAYSKMLGIFRERYWLAEPSTQEYFPALVDFVELWDRSQKDALPGAVVRRLHADEDQLAPFYSDLELRLTQLKSRLAGSVE